ncbi:hypothetical protein JL721_6629 [Aureococcus anophagefferens]|nr:hypothetical protein JL721_6629 [Aureococcus anophagefferens]
MSIRKEVEKMSKRPENMHCADCRAPKPNWASCSLGTFICFNCSGLHRGLGTHLSFVRSVTLDEWTQKQANVMQLWGNANANSFFEARMPPDFKKPDQHASVNVMNKFIRDKYERCNAARGEPPGAAGRAAAPGAGAPAAPPPPDLLSFDARAAAPAAAASAVASGLFRRARVRAAAAGGGAAPAPPQSDLIMSMFNQPMQQPQAFAGMPGGFGAATQMPGGLPQQPQPAYQMAGNFQQPMAGGAFQQQPMGGGFPPQQHAYQAAAAFPPRQQQMPGGFPQQAPMPGGFGQQSPMPGGFGQQSQMPGGFPPQQQQAQMPGGRQPQQAQMPGGFGQQQQAQMPGGFGQQQQPMGAMGGAMGGGAMGGSLGYPPAQQPPQQQRSRASRRSRPWASRPSAEPTSPVFVRLLLAPGFDASRGSRGRCRRGRATVGRGEPRSPPVV